MAPLEEIFCLIDDFCKQFEETHKSKLLPNPLRKLARLCSLSISETCSHGHTIRTESISPSDVMQIIKGISGR